jgi:integrase
MKLTGKAVAALTLPAGKTDHFEWDDEIAGFGYRLRLGADGKVLRSWNVQYKRAGTTRRMLLGSAAVLGAEAARLQARKVLGRVALGEDPAGDRRDRRDKDRNSLRALIDEYLAAKRSQVRSRTFVEIERYLTGGYFKPLHGMPVDTITRRDVSARVVAIARTSGDPTAREARGALSTFFVWCLRMGLCEANPVNDSFGPAAIKARERVLIDQTIEDVKNPQRWRELVAVWRATGEDEYGKVIKLLILTGCRRAEIGDMCWGELDDPEQPSSFTIPASRSKNKRPHTLPVMPMMREIIASVPKMATRDQLFGHRARGFTAWHQGKAALDERAGVTTSWVVHDLRRTVATGMADLGVQPHIIEAALNHFSGHRAGVAGTYNRSPYANEIRNALAAWHDHLRTITAGGERKVLNFSPQTAS